MFDLESHSVRIPQFLTYSKIEIDGTKLSAANVNLRNIAIRVYNVINICLYILITISGGWGNIYYKHFQCYYSERKLNSCRYLKLENCPIHIR